VTHYPILDWFAYLWIGDIMRKSTWLYPLAQIVHFIGLCFLIGAILMVDLRLMGFFRRMSIRAALSLIPVAIAGFAVNAITGLAFFSSDPYRFWFDDAFRWKLLAIVAAGVNALWFTFAEQRKVLSLAQDAATNGVTRFCAAFSIASWFSVILFGRLLPVYQP
jgi:hypothetical protein